MAAEAAYQFVTVSAGACSYCACKRGVVMVLDRTLSSPLSPPMVEESPRQLLIPARRGTVLHVGVRTRGGCTQVAFKYTPHLTVAGQEKPARVAPIATIY